MSKEQQAEYINQAFKYRLYRSRRNRRLYQRIDIAGIIWNHCVALQRRYYKLTGKYISANRLKKHLKKLKYRPKYEFWQLLDAQAIQDVVERLDRSYQLFFKSKRGEIGVKMGRPSFKKVKKYSSFTLKQAHWQLLGGNKVKLHDRVYKFGKHREIAGEIKTVTVKRDKVGNLWLCFAVRMEMPKLNVSTTGRMAGFDFGLKTFLTVHDGFQKQEIQSPQFLKQLLHQLRQANRSLSRKQEGSKGWHRAKQKLARLHWRIADKRRDWFFKLANELTERYDYLFFETLNLRGMQRLWGRKVSDLAFRTFLNILEHVAKKKGKLVHYIDRFYPSSKECHYCHHVNRELTLDQRRWRCPECNRVVDREENAALNILSEGASSLKREGYILPGESGRKTLPRSATTLTPLEARQF